MKPAVEAINLSKKFEFNLPPPDSSTSHMWFSFVLNFIRGKRHEIKALDRVSFKVNYGELFCIVGPNGAGKTTLLKILSTILLPDEGTALVNGFDILEEPDEVKASVTVVPGAWWITLDWSLTVRENLVFWTRIFGYSKKEAEERVDYILELLDLKRYENSYPSTLSSGYRQRVALARGLAIDSPIFLLDEPTVHLDPISAENFREFVKRNLVLKLKRTVIWTTHVLSEAERISDRIAILNRGKIVACGTLSELCSKVDLNIYEIRASGVDALSLEAKIQSLKKSLGKNTVVRLVQYRDRTLVLKVIGEEYSRVERAARLCFSKIDEIKEIKPSLEEAFVYYAGGSP
ncbi:MAG: hypothetical protein DRJ52_11070 [Thermoprotei archaeon]|nr:MAG: hypothetical protein DRJ52_11070 [Thermoprotei archaeon]